MSNETMRAVMMKGFGPADEAMELRLDHPRPQRKEGEVLLKVVASSINPAEWRVRQGALPKAIVKLPQILGADVSGVVLEADEGSKFKAGDRVFGYTDQILLDPWGTYAEFCSAKEKLLMAIPEGISFEVAAAMPIAGITAWQALAPSMPLEGKRVLVHAGAGGIGHLAVQIAKAQGAYVATTCSGRNVEFCTKTLGADLAIDYTKDKFEEVAGDPYDLVVDLVGEVPRSFKVLKSSGRMAQVSWDQLIERGSFTGWLLAFAILFGALGRTARSAMGLGPKYQNVMMAAGTDNGLKQLAELVVEGKVKVHVDQVVPLEGVIAAHAEAEKKRTRGKVVIKVAEP